MSVVLLMTGGAGETPKQSGFNPAEVMMLAIAPNGKRTAVVTDDPRALWLIADSGPAKVMLPPEVSQPRVSWSTDSRYVAVEYQINDDASAVHIADVGQNPPVLIDAGRGHSAKWSRSGHTLFIVPDFGVTELPTTARLIGFDPTLRTRDVVTKEYYFLGRYDVGASNVVAQAIQYVEGRPRYSLIAYDLKNGSVEVIARAGQ